jgi:hypothetical protein
MGKRIIISESEKKNILSLYEQDSNEFKKENDFLKRYVGKTFNEYSDKQLQKLWGTDTISSIEYDSDGLSINYKEYVNNTNDSYSLYTCNYNPSKIGYEGSSGGISSSKNYDVYNKTLIDDINQKGAASGIKWCQKPKADFGTKTVNEDVKTTVPPPSESVLVANKNPFKYPEYELARRRYTSDLKNGDLFYVDKGAYNYYKQKEDEYKNFKILKPLYELKGKTLRGTDDKIYVVWNMKYFKGGSLFKKDETNIMIELKEKGNENASSSYNIYFYGDTFIADPNNQAILNGLNVIPKTSVDKISELLKNELKNDFNLPYSEIPDEYFEIRKVQRQQTDF